jgi:hypothetical protein
MPYAIVTVHSHPRETFDQQKSFLHERIIPMIKSQPGFVTGYWGYDGAERVSNSYVVFATEADARRVAAFVKDESGKPNPFDVRPLSVTVVEVVGEARA